MAYYAYFTCCGGSDASEFNFKFHAVNNSACHGFYITWELPPCRVSMNGNSFAGKKSQICD